MECGNNEAVRCEDQWPWWQLVATLHPGVVDSVSGVKQVKAENCVGPVLILTVQCGV